MADKPRIFPVILGGGSGASLWPFSRDPYFKNFEGLFLDDKSLLQHTAERLQIPQFEAPVLVTSGPDRFMVAKQLAECGINASAILIEPEPRRTDLAILAAAFWIWKVEPGALVVVMPSGHQIPNVGKFRDTVSAATSAAAEGKLLTFGVKPTSPETGYGYLELAPGANSLGRKPQKLESFVEKPDQYQAIEMLLSGRHLWNVGIFMFSVISVIQVFIKFAPETLLLLAAAVHDAREDLGFIRLSPDPWARAQRMSIGDAIIEKADNLWVMPLLDTGWSDLGGLANVWHQSGADEAGNASGRNSTQIDCGSALLRPNVGGVRLVGIGLQDIVAVATPNAVLFGAVSEGRPWGEAVATLKAGDIHRGEGAD